MIDKYRYLSLAIGQSYERAMHAKTHMASIARLYGRNHWSAVGASQMAVSKSSVFGKHMHVGSGSHDRCILSVACEDVRSKMIRLLFQAQLVSCERGSPLALGGGSWWLKSGPHTTPTHTSSTDTHMNYKRVSKVGMAPLLHLM